MIRRKAFVPLDKTIVVPPSTSEFCFGRNENSEERSLLTHKDSGGDKVQKCEARESLSNSIRELFRAPSTELVRANL